MEITNKVLEAIKQTILPELNKISSRIDQLTAVQEVTNKRLDDINGHLIEQGRRIDTVNERIDSTNERIDALHVDLENKIQATNERIDATNDRLNNLYEVIVRREEHSKLEYEFVELKARVRKIEEKISA